jgi:hypothetical protein
LASYARKTKGRKKTKGKNKGDASIFMRRKQRGRKQRKKTKEENKGDASIFMRRCYLVGHHHRLLKNRCVPFVFLRNP